MCSPSWCGACSILITYLAGSSLACATCLDLEVEFRSPSSDRCAPCGKWFTTLPQIIPRVHFCYCLQAPLSTMRGASSKRESMVVPLFFRPVSISACEVDDEVKWPSLPVGPCFILVNVKAESVKGLLRSMWTASIDSELILRYQTIGRGKGLSFSNR